MNLRLWIVSLVTAVAVAFFSLFVADWMIWGVGLIGIAVHEVLYLMAASAQNGIRSGGIVMYNPSFHLNRLTLLQWIGHLGALSSLCGVGVAIVGNIDFARPFVVVPLMWMLVYTFSPLRGLLNDYLRELK